jgi:hypothetical protein
MYSVDDKDIVKELNGVPALSVGAPMPLILANEHKLILVYASDESEPDWGQVDLVNNSPEFELSLALIEFHLPLVHSLGPPNDETLHGHPLANRGLSHYDAFEVLNSSWILGLDGMNSIHPRHNPNRFASFKHFIFTFHDSTFECIAESFKSAIRHTSMEFVLTEMVGILDHRV